MSEIKVEDIPQHAYDALARMILPEIQKFFSTPDGQQLFEEWKESQSNKNDDAVKE